MSDSVPGRFAIDQIRSRRAWWRRKRWIALLLLWLVVIYPFCMGPVRYCCHRGWLPWAIYEVYKPFKRLLGEELFHATYLWHWDRWWRQLAEDHEWENQRQEAARKARLND